MPRTDPTFLICFYFFIQFKNATLLFINRFTENLVLLDIYLELAKRQKIEIKVDKFKNLIYLEKFRFKKIFNF